MVTNEQCKTTMGPLITDNMICAGGVEGEDSCGVSANMGSQTNAGLKIEDICMNRI